ncbi:MAG: o-succinylbenzoate synthase [Acidimicrobiaceae bacterium]|nr:o-succinylbenzoate synthase [Acidimicrobiaceae bacterium]MXZ95183.1 o-succinylbenzoate synthase [Acidimicrobiaceae bacterium]MYF43821.1 o-succinylbenzoate synthase [Acidimicrobiaceae bacterium]MYJ35295.1 o-succinylbenzoate synthase [Acidimicrobiaceae bacterium]
MTRLLAELHPFRLALKAPLVTGGVSIRFRAGFLVSLTADGVTGWGEASPLPGWSRNSLLETEAALRGALDGIGEGGEAALDAVVGDLRDAPHARAGVTGAWADLQARHAEQPLAERLVAGSTCAPASEVAVNALIAAPEPSEVEQAAHDAVEAGFKAVKLKVGAVDPAVDVDRVRAARAGLGPGGELRLDANGAWDDRTALDVLSRVQDCDVAYCEEPVAGIDAIAAVSRRSPVPVAADESIRNESDAVWALDTGISNLIVKPQALGGPNVALAIATRAHKAEASVTVTSFLDSAVGMAHALHVAAAVDGVGRHPRAHGLATADLMASDVAGLPPVTAGVMGLPPGYGIGVAPAI